MDYCLKGEDRDYALANPQNLHPVFSQEQLATSLRATHLQVVSRDAISLADTSFPILDATALFDDIKAGLQIDPLAKWELDSCLKGSSSHDSLFHHRVFC